MVLAPHPEQIRVQRAAEAEREAATALPCVALGLLGAMPTPSPSHQPRPARGRSQRELPSPGTRPRVSGPPPATSTDPSWRQKRIVIRAKYFLFRGLAALYRLNEDISHQYLYS
jgi:hypothetical protein